MFFYRAANAIFGKVDRVATVEIILQVFAKSVILFRSLPVNHKKLSYRDASYQLKILPIATQQCRNYLYDKS